MDGILILNKEKEYTSHDVVAKVKKILNIKKVGHTGTLDPNATGVLPILIEKGTKLSKYLINHDKTYIATIVLGEKRDTADVEGKIIEKKQVKEELFNEENINMALDTFIGKQKQKPPIYSAIKVNGKKLYEYARKGQEVEIKERNIEIYSIKLIEFNNKNNEYQIKFEVSCSKGTYIRTLCESIAERLDTVGYMKELQRTKVGEFNISDSITLTELEIKKQDAIITLEEFFKQKENIKLNYKRNQLFLNGVKIKENKPNGIYKIYNDKNFFIGIGIIENNFLKRDIIL